MNDKETEYKAIRERHLCLLARITIETETPLKVGSGRKNVKTDATVIRDVNGLPCIPATSFKGVLRHAMTEAEACPLMGCLDGKGGDKKGHGSWLTLTAAKLVTDSEGHALDGLQAMADDDAYLQGFRQLPIRQHVRIDHRGVAEKGGKFDEEIVPQGVRFAFEMELRATEADRPAFDRLLDILQTDTFRIGGGSRKGFGKIKVVRIDYKALDFNEPKDFEAYICKSSSLSEPWPLYEEHERKEANAADAVRYTLTLTPADFLLFSSGLGDDRSDMTVVKEPIVTGWDNAGGPKWEDREQTIIVPASSVKGAIAHRTAFHFNASQGVRAEALSEEGRKENVGTRNEAVYNLFGSEKDTDATHKKRRGRVLISDVAQIRTGEKGKVLNHVAIDRFTGGTIDGALFAEEPLYAHDTTIKLCVTVLPGNAPDDAAEKALEQTLKDICQGTLPLGGGVNRGNGRFHGSLKKNDEKIYSYEQNNED